MHLSRHAAAILAALALPLFGSAVSAQTPAAPSGRTAPTMPPAASPSVPAKIGTPVAPAATTAMKKIDINAASEQDIATLPGIGPVTAKAIVDGRPWDDVTALSTKKVMSRPVFDRNKDRFALANINSSSAADMAKTLPGIGDATAPKIVNSRPYTSPQDLVTKKVLTSAQFAKIKDVVTY